MHCLLYGLLYGFMVYFMVCPLKMSFMMSTRASYVRLMVMGVFSFNWA